MESDLEYLVFLHITDICSYSGTNDQSIGNINAEQVGIQYHEVTKKRSELLLRLALLVKPNECIMFLKANTKHCARKQTMFSHRTGTFQPLSERAPADPLKLLTLAIAVCYIPDHIKFFFRKRSIESRVCPAISPSEFCWEKWRTTNSHACEHY